MHSSLILNQFGIPHDVDYAVSACDILQKLSDLSSKIYEKSLNYSVAINTDFSKSLNQRFDKISCNKALTKARFW